MFVKLRQLMALLARFGEIDDITNPTQFRELLNTIVEAAELIGLSASLLAMIENALANENIFKVVHAIALFIHGLVPQPKLMAACCPCEDSGDTMELMSSNGELTLMTQDGEEVAIAAHDAIAWVTVLSQLFALYQWVRENFPRTMVIRSE